MKNLTFAHAALSIASLAGCLSLAACTDVQSSDLKTAGMSAQMSVTADGSGNTQAYAQLHVDTSLTDLVTLSAGDTLVASVSGQTQTMSQTDVLGDVSYSAAFTGQDAPSTAYTIAFNRKTDTSATNNSCTLPAAFTINAPAAGGSFSRANSAISVTYGSSGTSDAMSYTVSGTCVEGAIQSVGNGDPGSFSIAKGTLSLPSNNAQSTQTCQATLTITRTRVGQIDPAFGSGGQISCVQQRTLTFTSTP